VARSNLDSKLCTAPVLRFYFHGRKKNELIENINMYIMCVIIIAFSAIMYAATYYQLKKQSRNIALQNSNDSRAQEIRILKEKRFLKTIIIIACIAFICVVPTAIFYQVHDALGLFKRNLTSEILSDIFASIFYINFAVNPLIYVVRLPNYQKTFYLLYWRRGS
jgi:predicted neutral ceramidase superfamily lipid hydrolase